MLKKLRFRFFYLAMAVGILAAVVYQIAVARPLTQLRRDLDRRLEETIRVLGDAGFGMSADELNDHLDRIRQVTEYYARISQSPAHLIRFPAEVETLLARPFQLIDYEHRKFITVDILEELATQRGVRLLDGLEESFPDFLPSVENPLKLWAQLTMMDQLIRAAVQAEVMRVDEVRSLPVKMDGLGKDITVSPVWEIPVRMKLTGDFAAIHTFLLMMPLTDEDWPAAGLPESLGKQSSFHVSRLIMLKNSQERANEVSLDMVVSGFWRLPEETL